MELFEALVESGDGEMEYRIQSTVCCRHRAAAAIYSSGIKDLVAISSVLGVLSVTTIGVTLYAVRISTYYLD